MGQLSPDELARLRERRPSRPDGPRSVGPEESRSEFERDLDRLIYSPFFRRLAEVTQVTTTYPRDEPADRPIPHTRMTHSIKVGQVGRRLAQSLPHDTDSKAGGLAVAGPIAPDVVEAAGRGHDLGHPPFGHIGERELDQVARAHGLRDGFEGNAQTLRVIATLGRHRPVEERYAGMDLTAAVTAACVKYPWGRGKAGKEWFKFGYYEADRAFFRTFVEPLLPQPGVPTLEAEIMDWADDITYAVHDVEDFFLSRLIPLERLACLPEREQDGYVPLHREDFEEFWRYANLKLELVGKPLPPDRRLTFTTWALAFPQRPFDGTGMSTATMGRLCSRFITFASRATHVRPNGRLHVDEDIRVMINLLKELTWYFVIDRPELAAHQLGERTKLRSIAEQLIDWSLRRYATERREAWPSGPRKSVTSPEVEIRSQVLPVLLREKIDAVLDPASGAGRYGNREKDIVRSVIDYVAALREREVNSLHDALGMWSGTRRGGLRSWVTSRVRRRPT